LVVEVGPGEGVLTEELAKHAKKVVAIEIDKNLAQRLDSRFPASPAGGRGNDKVEIINDDVLKINLPEILGRVETPKLGVSTAPDYKIIANIPYYITSPIIQLFLETKYPPKEMILMVQKEVAERIVEKPGNMSILALSVQYYAKAKLLFYVDRKSFYPVPEVDSAVIRITRNVKRETKEEAKKFFRIVRAGFSAKRKTLANNLSSSLHLEKSKVEEKLKTIGIQPTARAQELSLKEWKLLSQFY
jgi:16S rRNA (adenine1518-N6/adenine1519-N6)-dimethyltransferase